MEKKQNEGKSRKKVGGKQEKGAQKKPERKFPD